MIVDGKVRKMKFSERVRENFERFKEIVERKGRDVLVAGIIGAGILVGGVKAQGADSLVVDTSSVHIDSTYIDWSKPRFMGLTYGYYYDWPKIVEHKAYCLYNDYGMSYDDAVRLRDSLQLAGPIVKGFPYMPPPTKEDTIRTIIDYFESWYKILPKNDDELEFYKKTHPNKGQWLEYDWRIVQKSPYWSHLLELGRDR